MAIRKRYFFIAGIVVLVIVVSASVLAGTFFLAAFFYLTTSPAIEFSQDDSQATRIEIVEAWQESLLKTRDFNGAILAIKDGEVLISKCCGHADAARTVELTPQTSMRLGSVSKQFTAAAILMLAEREQLGLDDLVSGHLKDFPYDDVTVRHLLNMTSGIPDCYLALAEKHRDELGDCVTIADVPRLIAKDSPAREGPVNTAHRYSNTSYVLLAAIIESAAGSSFEDFLAKELFQPLGMKNTRVWNLVSKDKSFAGQAETFFESEVRAPGFLDGVAGDGGVFSSLDDFRIWDQFWRGNDFISPELMQQAFERPTLADGSSSDYGFGWVIEDNGHWHNGAWLAAHTYTYQDDDFFLIILNNSDSHMVDSMGWELRRTLDE